MSRAAGVVETRVRRYVESMGTVVRELGWSFIVVSVSMACAKEQSPTKPPESARAAPTASASFAPSLANEELRVAIAIRAVLSRYLTTQRAEAQSHVPSDWVSVLPADANEPEITAKGILLAPWQLELEGDRATLRYTPAQGIQEHHRFWFELELELRQGTWQIGPRGVTFAHASRREPLAR